jgi:aspartyl-tRNA(Asn)/glutamyl-tRNA(Gln) amidotransferase subunit C
MNISREEVLHIARLARLGVTEEDVERLAHELSNIVENFAVLEQVDTTNVPPTAQPIPLENVMKPDEVCPSLPREAVLANAPKKEREFIKIKIVLEG